MSRGLRVFVSSTEDDLANERAELATRLKLFNFEPVTSEELLPNGQGIWQRLRDAIETSDLFVLILGDLYGDIPSAGPMASAGKSVTHLEYDTAKATGLPIFVFTKTLGRTAPRDTADAYRRDAFREEVQAWEGGHFRREFQLASELADHAGRAIVAYLTDQFQTARVDRRRPEVQAIERGAPERWRRITLPGALVEAVASRSAILLLGTGVSLQAGLPSAPAFIQAMVARIRRVDPDYEPGASGSLFNAVATDFESLLSLDELWLIADSLVNSAYSQPTHAHRTAARLFTTVVTTNFDLLFEKALEGIGRRIVHGETADIDFGDPALIKLHGSIDDPRSLVLTESDLANLEATRPVLWRELGVQLRNRPVLAVGSSLRDPSLVRLLESCRPELRGWAVLRSVSEAQRRRLGRYGLDALEGDADSVLEALDHAVSGRGARG